MTELGAPARDAMGDVDVLAWRDNVACICECKELLFARTIGEVADQLVRFRGKAGDDLDKHLRRVSFLERHTAELSRITGIGSVRIVPLLVTSKLVPMQFVRDIGAQVISADQITQEYLRATLAQGRDCGTRIKKAHRLTDSENQQQQGKPDRKFEAERTYT